MRFLLPFYDDSTLMFATRLRPMLESVGIETVTLLETDKDGLSDRQREMLLPEGPDMRAESSIFGDSAMTSFDAVVTSLGGKEIRTLLKKREFRDWEDRPAFVSFNAGLDFTPERGIEHRRNYDIVFLNNIHHARRFLERHGQHEWRYVSFGHPYFTIPEQYVANDPTRRDIYFFAQSISPSTLESRRFIADMLVTLANLHCDRTIYLKLRHLPGENDRHLHRELFDYPWLLERYFQNSIPQNLILTACSMSEALKTAGICITCTSTAAMDCISAGLPTLVYTDYPENYRDPLAGCMAEEFAESRLLASLPQVMDLSVKEPDEKWLAARFRTGNFLGELKSAVAAFKTRTRIEPPEILRQEENSLEKLVQTSMTT